MKPKRVLLIAYYFPPIGGSGTQRPVKFVKYLPQFGWQPYVITTDRPYGGGAEGRDETLLADIPPDVQVWRVPTPQPQPVKRLAQWVNWCGAAEADIPTSIEVAENADRPRRTSLGKQIRHIILSPLLAIQNPPIDPALYWSLRIVPMARRLILHEQIDAVLTTAAPWSALLAGRLLQRLTRRPWVADFRDPWTDNNVVYFPTPAQHKLNTQVERYLINRANAVVSVTEPWVAALRRKASMSMANKPFVLIPNGWDRDDFPNLSTKQVGLSLPESVDGHIVFLHSGNTHKGELSPLLKALDQLAADRIDLGRLRFHFVGYVHPEERVRIHNSPHVQLFQLDIDRVPHNVALHLMRNAHVLLLLRKGTDGLPGKTFEYMVAGRPVLVIGAKDGVAGQLVRECGIGCAVDADDISGLSHILLQIAMRYRQFVTDNYRPEWVTINRFERRALANKLAETLDWVIRHT
jgi:hypothetical protein